MLEGVSYQPAGQLQIDWAADSGAAGGRVHSSVQKCCTAVGQSRADQGKAASQWQGMQNGRTPVIQLLCAF